MRLCLTIVAFCVAAVAGYEQAGNVKVLNGRSVSSTLFLSNPYDAGNWGPIGLCNEYSFVHAIEILFHPAGAADETAINGVRLYCSTEDHQDEGYVTSSMAPDGDWYGMRVCKTPFVTGFRGKVLSYQGIFTDDVAVQDFEAECDYGSEILPGIATDTIVNKFGEGEWSTWAHCSAGTAVCGLQTRVEPPQLLDDDTALTDINLFCCPRSNTTEAAVQ